ncbi:MAG TPA: SMP-30/gluconolactonase/LRE family protein [Burkholderiaceae bacterium]|nr:SMP-30/gluconolactonase/LRE family protein [Burkholderiaceae bacterium]
MFAAPPIVDAQVFARLPDTYRKPEATSEWHRYQPGRQPAHSLLEGPSFDHNGNLYCVDVPWGRVFRVSPQGEFTLVAEYDGEPNGLKLHRDGRIFIADYSRGILVLDPESGQVEPLIERVQLERLKAVNDLVFASNGDLYFTDQGLTGLHDSSGRVFRRTADGRIDCLLDRVPSPNGLVLDASETTLYVAVTRANAIWRVPLTADGRVTKVGTFIQMSGGGGPDGLAIDEEGNLAVAHVGLGAVWLFSHRGEPMLRINAPTGALTTNIAYGGPDRKTLYITESESGSILTAEMPVPGRKMFSGV